MTTNLDRVDGLLLIDKPTGITSRAAVDRVLGWFPRGTSGGHTGTLDPLATGILVVCLGVATRLAEYIERMHKIYHAELLLGVTSDTDDADGSIVAMAGAKEPMLDTLSSRLQQFVGEVEQVPPAYSAAKVEGRRAYKLARAGQSVSLRSRQVHIFAIHLLAYSYPRVEMEVQCSKGTYIRSLARDLGQRLNCGALIQSLRRTRLGPFEASRALSLDASAETARSALLPLTAAVSELPSITAGAEMITRLRTGQAIPMSGLQDGVLPAGACEVAVLDEFKCLAAVTKLQSATGLLTPHKVFGPR
jgi:tRNA pseudouridine55 synthase